MLLPTQDKKAISQLAAIHLKYCGGVDNTMVIKILEALEKLGYHKDLPTSIEKALNSGGGTYKP